MLLMAIEATYPGMRLIHVFLDNARYHHAKLAQAWLARPGCRIKLHFIPAYCPHLNPIERLWGLMDRHTTHKKCYSAFKDFSDAMLTFLRDDARRPALALERPEKRFGGRDIPFGAEPEIDRLSLAVDRAIEAGPAALDLHGCFVDARPLAFPIGFAYRNLKPAPPRGAGSASEPAPAPFKLGNIAFPAHDCVWSSKTPRSAIISTRSRKLSLNRRRQRTQRMMISRSKWRPLKRSSMFSIGLCILQRRICGDYAPLQPFAPEPGYAPLVAAANTMVAASAAPNATNSPAARSSGSASPPMRSRCSATT